MQQSIELKMKYTCKSPIPHEYEIIDTKSKQKVGNVIFRIVRHKLIIGFLSIRYEYQGQGYGSSTISYLLSHYKIDCVIGESLMDARTFWNKMIKQFNGQRHNISVSESCSSSFVIPKCKISNEELYKLLELSLDI